MSGLVTTRRNYHDSASEASRARRVDSADDLEASDRRDGVGTAYLAVPRTSMRPIRIALTTASSFE